VDAPGEKRKRTTDAEIGGTQKKGEGGKTKTMTKDRMGKYQDAGRTRKVI